MSIKGTYRINPVHFIGVSIPRSGHHLLARLIESIFQDDVFYCEYYDEPGCCHSIPCLRRRNSPISFQKSHDFDLDIANDIAESIYLIQHRRPIPSVLSAREHYAREQYDQSYGKIIGSNCGEYAVWLGINIPYYTGFMKKWVLRAPQNSIVIDYDELQHNTSSVLTRIFNQSNIIVPDSVIAEAISLTISRAGRRGEITFTPRSIDRSEYFNKELLTIYESIILDELPHLAHERVFEPVDYAGTLIWSVFEARRLWQLGAVADALSVIDDALIASPEVGLLLHERALLLQVLGQVQEAQAALLRAANLPPPHPQILSTLIAVSSILGDTTTTEDATRALTALVGPRLGESSPAPALQAPAEEARSQTPSAIVSREQQLERREAILADREAIAAERLRLIGLLGGDPRRVYETLAHLRAELQQKDAVIADLHSAIEERRSLIDRLDTEARVLRETLEERRSLIDRLDTEARVLRETLEERRSLIDRLDTEAGELRAALEERRSLIDRLDTEAGELRAALEAITDELKRKEIAIAEIHEAAEERRQIIEVLDAEIRRLRTIAMSPPMEP